MTGVTPPPFRTNVLEELGMGFSLPWVEHLNDSYEGDTGTPWAATFVSLTGTFTVDAVYSQINQSVVLFSVTITPSVNVSSTAGTTYISGFPLQFVRDTVCNAVHGGVGETPGHVEAATNRIYIPALSSVSDPITITGIGIAR